MIGKPIPKPKSPSLERLNDYVLNRSGRGGVGTKVLFAGTLNMLGGIDDATYEMQCVMDQNRRAKFPVDHYLLAWDAGEQPTAEQTREAVEIALKELNLERCQCLYALHRDTDNCHVHISVNRIDLETHKAIDPAGGWTERAMERAARRIEHRQGWNVAPNTWTYVDADGVLHEHPQGDRSGGSVPQKVADKENATGEKSAIRMAKERLKKISFSSWADFHEKLATMGMSYERKGSGAVIHVGDVPIKASDAGKRYSIKALEKMLGAYEPPTDAPEKKPLPPEPLSKTANTDWQEYEQLRRRYTSEKHAQRDELFEQIEAERETMRAAHKQERLDAYGGRSWKGKGAELNLIKSAIAAKHAGQKLDLKERHDAMKKRFKDEYPALPSYEEWLRDRGKYEDAEAWRYRASNAKTIAQMLPPSEFIGDAAEVKDIRGFTAVKGKKSTRYMNPSRSTLSFSDYGAKIRIYDHDPASALAAMQLGMQKWGSVRIDGPESYKKMCVELAARNGIKLSPKSLQHEVWAYQDAQLKREREVEPPRVDGACEAFAKYHEAVGADHYRVTATQFFKNGGKRGFMVNRKDGAPDGYTAEQLVANMPRLVSLEQTDNRNIYYTPISETKHHLVIDDLTPESLAEMISDGYQPCAVIETSPNNWQAIITIPKMGTDLDRQVANAVVAELNKKYGDPKFTGEVHPHRAPGFENRKPKHRTEQDTYPDVKLVKSRKVECPKTIELAKRHFERLEDLAAERAKNITRTAARSSDVPTGKAYAAHFEGIYHSQREQEAQTGKPIDMSIIDLKIATRLRATGHSQEEIVSAIEVMSPRMREAVGKDPNAHNWKDYAARTASAAFGYKGDKQIERLASYIPYWETIEGKTEPTIETPKPQDSAEQTQEAPAARPSAPQNTEAPKPKPLSADADKKRLEALNKNVEDYAYDYAKGIMDTEAQTVIDAANAKRPAAEQALAEARSALEAHEETEVELTFFERTFGGKSAEAKIAAYDKRTAELSGEVKRCERAIADLDYEIEHPHGFSDTATRRRNALKAEGRAEYDRTHPEEAAERTMLHHLYQEKLLYLNFTSNPVSQSGGHAFQKGLVADVFEIEARRGLTQDETIAKHKGVRNVVEIIEKYRGREIDRGRGR